VDAFEDVRCQLEQHRAADVPFPVAWAAAVGAGEAAEYGTDASALHATRAGWERAYEGAAATGAEAAAGAMLAQFFEPEPDGPEPEGDSAGDTAERRSRVAAQLGHSATGALARGQTRGDRRPAATPGENSRRWLGGRAPA
jgi:hypothetical protein